MLTLKDAQKIVASAEQKAIEIGQPMNIAVVDHGGNLITHVRMDEAWIGSIDIAIKKAYTARAFNISTKELAAHSQCGGEFFGIHASNNGKVMIFAGGIPLKQNGTIVGAIGVSGGSGKQDQEVAEAGVAGLTNIEGIFHCNVNCTDLDRSLTFYEMLGFKVITDFSKGMSSAAMAKAFGLPYAELRGVHLTLENDPKATRIDLVEFLDPKTEGQPYPNLNHTGVARICLRTNDIHQVYENLKARSVNFLSEPQKLPGTDATIVCFTDPDGNVLELLEGAI
ncbi:heme-binding protein [Nostoc sp. CENA67]|uniref:Heme-binding protein n=1 Tax=Amazonocrinis nigriterrae CENA67 TaxID=2794033 RepID=A0A8J7L8C9_9NOST|nr:heme-binding protein [Amazonocrinis nigriterrae]MBH8563065.1 heme-binding protein [Amazonocrinis nigriterrae CENA67]